MYDDCTTNDFQRKPVKSSRRRHAPRPVFDVGGTRALVGPTWLTFTAHCERITRKIFRRSPGHSATANTVNNAKRNSICLYNVRDSRSVERVCVRDIFKFDLREKKNTLTMGLFECHPSSKRRYEIRVTRRREAGNVEGGVCDIRRV